MIAPDDPDRAARRLVFDRLREGRVDIRVAHAATAAFLRVHRLARVGEAVHVESALFGPMGVGDAVKLWLASPEGGARYLPAPDRGYPSLCRPRRIELVSP